MHAIAKVECANNCFALDSWPFPGLHSTLSQDLKSRCFSLGVSHQIFATPLFAVRYLENDRYQLSRVSVRLKAFTAAFTIKKSTNSTVHYRHSRCLLFAHGCSWAATVTHHSHRFVGSWFILAICMEWVTGTSHLRLHERHSKCQRKERKGHTKLSGRENQGQL